LNGIAESLAALDENGLREGMRSAMDASVPTQEIMRLGIGRGMQIVGEKYEKGEYFLSDLIIAGETMKEAMEMIRPLLKSENEARATAIIGTVQGDLHDLGKNLVISMLTSAGLKLHDLGTDVSPSTFVEKAEELKPDMVCMSALLSVALPKVKESIDALEKAGVRTRTRVLVGGRCLNQEIAAEMGADSYGEDAWDAVKKAKELLRLD